MIYPPEHARKGPRRNQRMYMLAVEYLLWPQPRPHGLLKALAHANGTTPSRLNSLASAIRGAK